MEEQLREERERLIFHVDVNSAFLSWSAVHRLEEDPDSVDLRTIPAIVGGDRETRHGIVTAKSIPAAKLGIKTADPVVKALQKCPDLVIIPSDFALYRRYSKAFIKILKQYAPVVEQASIDEAYVDVTGVADRSTCEALAGKIRDEVRGALRFTVNVGISTNKLLAKMASDFEKPDKTHTLFPEEITQKMWPLSIRDLYGCGRQTAARLNSLGIQTIGDAAALPMEYLQTVLGEKGGEYIWRAANGISESPVTDVREEAKSCSNEITTPYDITADNYEKEMPGLIRHLSDKVSSRLQKDGMFARTIGVVIKTSDFKRHSMQVKQEDSVNDADTIRETAAQLAAKLMLGEKGVFARDLGVRLVGVTTADLDHGEYRQLNLMDLLLQGGSEEVLLQGEAAAQGKAAAQAETEARGEAAAQGKSAAQAEAEVQEETEATVQAEPAKQEETAAQKGKDKRKGREDCGRAAEEAARQEAEETARREAEETARREAEETARREAEENARREAEEAARREAEENARREAEENARREAEEAAEREAEEAARREAEEAAEREAGEVARREAEENARREAEEAARREAAEEKRREKEARLRKMEQQIRARFGSDSVRRGKGRQEK